MNKFPPVALHVGMVDYVIQKNGVTPDDDDGDEDDGDGKVALLAMQEE